MARGPVPDRPQGRPTVPAVVALARRYYSLPGNGFGGALHIALDDGNLKDDHLLACSYRAMLRRDAAGIVLAAKLLAMTRTQRRKVCSRLRGAAA